MKKENRSALEKFMDSVDDLSTDKKGKLFGGIQAINFGACLNTSMCSETNDRFCLNTGGCLDTSNKFGCLNFGSCSVQM